VQLLDLHTQAADVVRQVALVRLRQVFELQARRLNQRLGVAARQAERDLAAARIDVAAADRVATTQSVSERIADAWIDVWAAERQRHLLGDLRDEATVAVQTAQARLRGGEGSATEALAARGDLGSVRHQ